MDIWLQLLVNGAILLTIQYFSCGSTGKDLGSIPGMGRSPGEEKDYALLVSGLENSMGYSPWALKSQT